MHTPGFIHYDIQVSYRCESVQPAEYVYIPKVLCVFLHIKRVTMDTIFESYGLRRTGEYRELVTPGMRYHIKFVLYGPIPRETWTSPAAD
jgi:hypothetical protein